MSKVVAFAALLGLLAPTAVATVPAPPGDSPPGGAVEPALRQLESNAAQSRARETVVIDEILARVKRMTATVADLHTLIEAMPAARCSPATPVAPACPPSTAPAPGSTPPPSPATATKPSVVVPKPPVAAPAKAASSETGLIDLPWQPIAAAAAVLALLGLLWRQRRRRDEGQEALTVTQPSVPPSLAKPVVQDREVGPGGTPTPPPVATPGTAAPPTTASPSAVEPPPQADAATADADLSLELAEVMLSMGLTDGAAQTLTDHIQSHPRQALLHWLKLLDIYRKQGMRGDFEKSAQEIQQHFNVAPPDWEPNIGDELKAPSLDGYAHVISRVQELWPRRSCAEYLNRLLEDNRGGTRSGFPQPVVEEILLLIALLRELGR